MGPLFEKPLYVGRPHYGDRARFHQRVDEILDRGWLTTTGPVVAQFEREIAEYLDVRQCVATRSGTAALQVAGQVLGFTGEVIVPAFTFIATAQAVLTGGGRPVFADIDPATHNLDPRAVRRRLSGNTSGILGVHLWGRPAPVEDLQAVADDAGLPLIFDAAHAFGVTHRGAMVGGNGRLEVLSFNARKFFNTIEGGAIVTNDDDLAGAARRERDRSNVTMTEPSAAMGLVNLAALPEVIEANRANHQAYTAALAGTPRLRLLRFDESERNNHQYVVLEVEPATRASVIGHLHAHNVLARTDFWPGCHRMPPFVLDLAANLPHLPVTEDVASRVILLPTGPAVTPEDCSAIARLVLESAR